VSVLSSLDPLPSPPLLAFKISRANVADVLFALSFSWKPRRLSLFIYVTVDVTAGVAEWLRREGDVFRGDLAL
jgi:hypothetical protein